MKSQPRLFTLEEANALIPVLEKHLQNIQTARESHTQRHDVLLMHQLLESAEGHQGHESVSPELESEIKQMENEIAALEHEVAAIQSLGCVVRSLNKGFVDFLSERQGEKVFLCWKKGETVIRFYHPVKGSMTQRLPL